ncbi:MAG: lipopolysaccharide heptosyltransferase II [Acidobacteriota bacterium]
MSGGCLVRLPSWLGDTVMSIPILRALERAFPGRLTLWGKKRFAGLLASVGLKTSYIPYGRRRGLPGLWDATTIVAVLRRRRPDLALLLPNAFEPALLSTLAGIPKRVGYATDGRAWLLTDAVTRIPFHHRIHDADRFAGLLPSLDIEAPRADDGLLEPSPQMRERARHLLPAAGDFLGLVPGAANGPSKRWPATAYAALASAAAERWHARPVLLGSTNDLPVTEEVRAACKAECLDLVGTDLVDLAAALMRCRVVVSNDSGAAHLAAALRCPTVVVFGPTDPQRTCPHGPQVRVAQAGCFCQPCHAHRCPLDHRCMTRLASETVLQMVDSLW